MNLRLFLSNLCNMECGYCPLDLNKGRAAVLSAEAAHKACEDHLRRFPGGKASFTLLGGEPLIHFPLLKGIVDHVRADGAAGTPIKVITNGSLLTPERADYLKANGVDVTVSLDGRAADNDAKRVLIGNGKSAFAEAWKGLELLGRERAKLNMVFCKETVGGLVDNIEFLRKNGFPRVTFNMDIFGEWPAESLGPLKAAMEDFVRYCRAQTRSSPGALDLGHLSSFSARTAYRTGESHGYRDIILGADGRYYACDGAFSSPYAALDRWAVGDAATGIDLRLRQEIHDQAQKAIHGWLGERHYTCPRQVYSNALSAGRDPRRAVEMFHAAENVVGAVLSPLAAEEGLGRD